MLSPFLIVGVGGSGGKTLRAVRQKLEMKLGLAGWTEGIPAAWQFLHYDTPVVQDGAEFPAPFLPAESYVGLAAAHASYGNIVTAIEAPLNKDFHDEAMRQIPNPKEVSVPVSKGAGQFRGVGRAVALSRLKQITDAASAAMSKAKAPESLAKLAQLSELFGGDPAAGLNSQPKLIVISSISGGSGAGQYIDIVDAIKAQFDADSPQWARHSYGILYAPDVFDGISGAGGVASNALAAVSETLNGRWNHMVDDSVVSLFAAQGVSNLPTGQATDSVGVFSPLIVGRQGATTTFAGQNDIYQSIASTLGAWMTEEKFQDSISAYFETNRPQQDAMTAVRTNFRQYNEVNFPPLGAIGFGRVTLAREEFLEYSKERIAKSCIDRLMKAHVLDAGDALFKHKSNEQYIKESIDAQRIAFFQESGFDEESEGRDQVIDMLRDPEINSRVEKYKLSVDSEVVTQIDSKKGGLDVAQWADRLLNSRYRLISAFKDENAESRGKKYAEWLTAAPEQLFATVSKFSVEFGLPVTAGLLRELSESVGRASQELQQEAERHEQWVAQLNSYLIADLGTAGQTPIIRHGSDAYNLALSRVGESFRWDAEAELRREVAELLKEAKKDFLEPLSRFVEQVFAALQGRAEADRNPDGRENDYAKWPGFDSNEVPKKYFPSSNEKMLVEADEFPEEFNRLIRASKSDVESAESPFKAVMRDVLTKRKVGEIEVEIPIVNFDPDSRWIPTATVGSGKRNIAQKGKFHMPSEISNYIEMAQDWLQVSGRPFGGYLGMKLNDYLDPKNSDGPAEFAKRKDRFLVQLKAAISASAPLAKINATLLNQLHEKSIGQDDTVMITPIPLPRSSEMFEATKQALLQTLPGKANESQIDKYFSDKPTGSIEIMQGMGHGALPLVFDSIMQPIASDWSRVNASASGRAGFWQWKRARLLAEAVPMDRQAFIALVEGWYFARAFNLLKVENNDTLGPKISVKTKDGTLLDFPHPLLYAGKVQPIDYIGAVVESSIIVQALANAASSLAPLKPYERLIDLGGQQRVLSDEIANWIDTGAGFDSADADSIASKSTTGADYQSRSNALVEFLNESLHNLEGNLARHRENASVYEMPIVYELLPDIREAINQATVKVASRIPNSNKDW